MGFAPPPNAVATPGNPLPPPPGTVAAFAAQLGAQASAAAAQAAEKVAAGVAQANQALVQTALELRRAENPSFPTPLPPVSFGSPGFEVCGVTLPKFTLSVPAPAFNAAIFLPIPPIASLFLQLPCGFALPINAGPGGGRAPSPIPVYGAEFV